MKVLIVCSGNAENFDFIIHHSFVYEQIETLKRTYDVEYDTFFVEGKGVWGYIKNLRKLKNKIKMYMPDFVHAHFGLSGLLACLQRKVPVIITFHGSDANLSDLRFLSKFAALLSKFNIFVSDKIHQKIRGNDRYSIIPCGINFDQFYPIDQKPARKKLKLDPEHTYILFASNFNNEVKNAPLAFSAVEKLNNKCELIELSNRSREEVNLLLNACDLLLLTSKSEGSPQIIKEAMACNCPVVATDVGDIRKVISETEGCYITSFDPEDVASKVTLALRFGKRTNGRERVKHFDNNLMASKVFKIYSSVLSK
ncbi:MAG TPA: glycosyltransferase family 4 protein [Ignavibacteriaceae bacterium]|nr:glycosyltransferase family 4 protein [Ignavibacteriaceae bacterium]